jgi:ABC-type sugar transport system ATPase subunit
VNEVVLELDALTKRYPGTLAVDRVSFALRRGEVHALLGANGAGKSTVVKMIAGDVAPTGGRLLLSGREVRLTSPHDALAAGIATIYQDLTVAPDLTVAENITLGRELRFGGVPGTVSRAAAVRLASPILDRLGARFPATVPVAELGFAERQLVAIARALALDCGVLLLDEPTAALTRDAADHLHAVIRGLRDEGRAILYISHRLDEIGALTERVTVLRDGRHVTTRPTSELGAAEIIRLMVGDVPVMEPLAVGDVAADGARDAPPALEVRAFGEGTLFDEVSFTVRRGEVLGVAGIPGSGREGLVRALVGVEPYDRGEVLVDGRRCEMRSPEQALKHGVMLLPGDRAASGLALEQSVRMNLLLPPDRGTSRLGWRSFRRERARASALVAQVGVRPPDPERLAGQLSGGNQQRVLFARALYAQPRVLLVDEPTQGVDVSGKAGIHELICDFAARGTAVVVSSSEFEELEAVCDRILVLRLGRVAGWVERGDYGGERLLAMALPA